MGEKKKGRPPIPNPKSVQIKVKAYKEDRDLLNQVCKDYNLTQYDILMQGIKSVTEKKK